MTNEIIDHLMEIKERLARIETTVIAHAEQRADHEERVDKIEKKVIKAEASMKTLRWIGGFLLVSLPATAAAIARIWKP